MKKPFVHCEESPDGICSWLSEDFPEDEGWDLYCKYCFRWKDWDEEEPPAKTVKINKELQGINKPRLADAEIDDLGFKKYL